MISTLILITILLIVLGEYSISKWLIYRNIKAANGKIPTELEGLYDSEKYEKQQSYFKKNNKFNLLTSTITIGLMLVLLATQAFGSLYNYCLTITPNTILCTLIFFGILMGAHKLIMLPFDIYDTFVIEQRFGFNKTTPKTFIGDFIKSTLITFILSGVLLSVITWIYTLIGNNFWWVAFIIITSISLLINLFYSQIIVPLFNKQTPLEEGELRAEIESFAKKAGFEINNIYVMDGSKRTTKANAYFTGMGKKKRIVLYDTLIEQLTTKEIIAVLAHEIGHYKKQHVLKNFIINSILLLIKLYILSLTLTSTAMAESMGVIQPTFAISLIAFGILYTPIDIITGLFMNFISRKSEYQADNFAKEYGLGEDLISGLKKISVQSLTNLTPDELYVKFYYSHPTLLQRILNLKK